MVDFNNEAMISKPPKDMVAMIILEKIYNFLEAQEAYTKQELSGGSGFTSVMHSRLQGLFLVTRNLLQRHIKQDEKEKKDLTFQEVSKICTPGGKDPISSQDILEAFNKIMDTLDHSGLWKLDTRQVWNRHDVEESNAAQGYR